MRIHSKKQTTKPTASLPLRLTRYLLLLLLTFTFISCDEDTTTPEIENSGIKIMPMGDSRVAGATPLFESYRYELWKLLVQNNWTFDFTGPFIDQGQYDAFGDTPFDTNHAGVGGHTTQDVLDNLDDYMTTSTGAPDVVLLGIGGNDALGGVQPQQILANINTIIDQIQAANPNVTIFIEQIAPGRSDIMTPELTAIFNQFGAQVQAIADAQTNSNSMVIPVDNSMGWTDNLFADQVHYNEDGAILVAQRYYDAIAQNIQK